MLTHAMHSATTLNGAPCPYPTHCAGLHPLQAGMAEAEMGRLKSLSCLQRDLKVSPGRPMLVRDSMRESR